MKAIDFVKWLDGFLDGLQDGSDEMMIVRNKLDSVDREEPFEGFPFGVIDEEEDDMVPYYMKCSCNPINGGNGVCGCTMANTLVKR